MGVYRNGSRNYIVDFVFRGQRVKRSTRQENRQVAVQIEARLRSGLAREEFDIKTLERRERCPGFAQFVRKEFLPWYRAAHPDRQSTYKRYVVSSRPLIRYFRNARLGGISAGSVEDFKTARLEKVSSAGTNRDLSALRFMLNFSIRKGYINRNPIENVEFLDEGPGMMRVVSQEEQARYLSAANALLRDVATLIVETGMRPEEVFSIQKQDVYPDLLYLFVPRGKTRFARRTIPLTEAALNVLRRRIEKARGSYLFPHRVEPKKHLTSVQKAHESAIAKVNPPFRIYDLRHTFGSRAAMAGVDLATLKDLMGHSSISVTMRYVHPTPEHKVEAMQKLKRYNVQQVFAAYEKHRPPTEIATETPTDTPTEIHTGGIFRGQTDREHLRTYSFIGCGHCLSLLGVDFAPKPGATGILVKAN